ncbi:MAG TPA: PA2779 family protein [Burkholderiales bacterium]|nr:PA2779 family protein [Burkholderiales bacterium]
MSHHARKLCQSLLAAGALVLSAPAAPAGIVATEELAAELRAQADRERVREFLGRENVERELKALGVAPELARKRVDALTDAEVSAIAGKLEQLPAGAALDRTDWILILLVAILLIVAL